MGGNSGCPTTTTAAQPKRVRHPPASVGIGGQQQRIRRGDCAVLVAWHQEGVVQAQQQRPCFAGSRGADIYLWQDAFLAAQTSSQSRSFLEAWIFPSIRRGLLRSFASSQSRRGFLSSMSSASGGAEHPSDIGRGLEQPKRNTKVSTMMVQM